MYNAALQKTLAECVLNVSDRVRQDQQLEAPKLTKPPPVAMQKLLPALPQFLSCKVCNLDPSVLQSCHSIYYCKLSDSRKTV